MFEDLVLFGHIWIFILDVGVIAACEPDTNDYFCHEGTLAAEVLTAMQPPCLGDTHLRVRIRCSR